jgi:hypothetical protein
MKVLKNIYAPKPYNAYKIFRLSSGSKPLFKPAGLFLLHFRLARSSWLRLKEIKIHIDIDMLAL